MNEDDKILKELTQAWLKLDNSFVSPTPNEGPAMVEEEPKEEPDAEKVADELRSHSQSRDLRLGDFM